MTDDEMRALCRKLKVPKIMWDSIGFRAALIRVYVAGQCDVAKCRAYRHGGLTPNRCEICGVHRDQHIVEPP
jgi:hypothetical protein